MKRRNKKFPRTDQLGGGDKMEESEESPIPKKTPEKPPEKIPEKSPIPKKIPEKTPEKISEKPEKKNSSKWIIFNLIIFLVLAWYFSQNSSKTNNNTTSVVVENQNSESARTLDVGSYNFELKAGEETEWFQMPSQNVVYRIGSPGDKWVIIFDDGKTVKGWDSEPIPCKDLAKFKVKSLQNQCIRIKIIAK